MGTAEVIIPAGSFTEKRGRFKFETELVQMELKRVVPFEFQVEASGLDLNGTVNPLEVVLNIGDDFGTVTLRLEGTLKLETDDDGGRGED